MLFRSPIDKANPVQDATDYTEDPNKDGKDDKPKDDKKPTLAEKFSQALDLRQEFVDKLNQQAQDGVINQPQYAQKSDLLRAVSLGEGVDEDTLNDFIDYVSK